MGNQLLGFHRRASPTWPRSQQPVTVLARDIVMDSVWAQARGTGANAFTARNGLAAYKFTTSASSFQMNAVSDGATGTIGVLVNGAWHTAVSVPTDAVVRTYTVTLPAGVNKTVEVWAGSQLDGAQFPGTFVESFRGLISPIIETPSRRLAVYGDSITQGYGATIAERDGYPALLRLDYPGRVSTEAGGGRTLLADFLGSPANIATQLTSLLFTATTREIWLAIGTNDWDYGYAVTNFTVAYGQLLDSLIAKNPGATIYAQTPVYRINEATPNAAGFVLADFRNAILTLATARAASGVVGVNAAAWLNGADLFDGLHPTTAGYAKMKVQQKAAIGY